MKNVNMLIKAAVGTTILAASLSSSAVVLGSMASANQPTWAGVSQTVADGCSFTKTTDGALDYNALTDKWETSSPANITITSRNAAKISASRGKFIFAIIVAESFTTRKGALIELTNTCQRIVPTRTYKG